jgi:hypothetical protein
LAPAVLDKTEFFTHLAPGKVYFRMQEAVDDWLEQKMSLRRPASEETAKSRARPILADGNYS